MRVTLLHNPLAGDDPASAAELLRDLRWAGYDVVYVPVESGRIDLPDDLGELLVVAGGDGTLPRVGRALRAGPALHGAAGPVAQPSDQSLTIMASERRFSMGTRSGFQPGTMAAGLPLLPPGGVTPFGPVKYGTLAARWLYSSRKVTNSRGM